MEDNVMNTCKYRFGNKKIISGLIMAVGMAVVTGCGMGTALGGDFLINAAVSGDTAVFGGVPYFRDDAGQNTQTVDGYLYGYWNNRLCRYDPETLEETALYEAASPQNGDFCIWGDYVYFMVVPRVNAVGKIHGYLYRVKCDGSEEAVCLTSVVMPGQRSGGQNYQYYNLDTYENVLYLLQQWEDEENLYFRLKQDGSIERIAESETLYGQLPEGNFTRCYDSTLTLPYAMRNYGYAFMNDDQDNLVRIDLESRQVERMDALKDYASCIITNDAVIVSKNNVWYRVSLDETDEIREIGRLSGNTAAYASWDEKGLYFTSVSGDESANLYFMDWEGGEDLLQYGFLRKQFSPIEYFDENYYYYVAESKGNDVVRRLELTGDEDTGEEVAVYRENPFWELTVRECFDYGWSDDRIDAGIDYSVTKVSFREDTGAFGKINDFMENLYTQDIEAVENFRVTAKEANEEYPDGWGPDYVESSDVYDVIYMDENYVGIVDCWNQYQWGAAHGMHGCIYYMFDKDTGERVSVVDVVNRSPEEICEIIAPYVEAAAAWGTDEEGWESMILDEGRFFLAEEGIGIHFNAYEIDCYAAGDREIIVPYSVFDLY